MVDIKLRSSVSPQLAGGSASSDSKVIYLTNNRSSQQAQEKISQAVKEIKEKMKGKPFMLLLAAPKFCKRIPIAKIEFRNGKVYKVTLYRISCNSWRCPNCRVMKAIKTRYLIRETAVLNNLFYFLTLTLDPARIPPEYYSKDRNLTHKYITKVFNMFRTDLQRKIKEKLKYIWVLEFQKNGRAHLHILLNQFIDIALISAIWVRVGGGKIMWVDKAKSVEALSFYLSSYIAKGLKKDISDKSYFLFFEKRYSISRSCARPSKKYQSLFHDLTKEEKLKQIKELGLDWVYNALTQQEFDEKLIVFENKEE